MAIKIPKVVNDALKQANAAVEILSDVTLIEIAYLDDESDPSAEPATTETRHPAQGFIDTSKTYHGRNDSTIRGDRRISILGDSIANSQKPYPGWAIEIDNERYEILSGGIKVDPVGALYECECKFWPTPIRTVVSWAGQAITTTGNVNDALFGTGGVSLIQDATIVVTGVVNDATFAVGASVVFTQDVVITTTGTVSDAAFALGTAIAFAQDGSIVVTGTVNDASFAVGALTFIQDATITTTGTVNDGTFALGTAIAFAQDGTIATVGTVNDATFATVAGLVFAQDATISTTGTTNDATFELGTAVSFSQDVVITTTGTVNDATFSTSTPAPQLDLRFNDSNRSIALPLLA